MMKKLKRLLWVTLAFFGLALTLSPVWGQIPLDGTFEASSFPPEDWLRVAGQDSKEWGRLGWSAHTGSGCAQIYGQAAGKVNDAWLITPMLRPEEGHDTLTFWLRKDAYTHTRDTSLFEVRLSTTGTDTSNFTVKLLTVGNNAEGDTMSTTWQKYSVRLDSYKNQEIFIAFRAYKNSMTLVLDDVAGVPLKSFAKDLKLANLAFDPLNLLFVGDSVTAVLAVVNKGTAHGTVKSAITLKVGTSEIKDSVIVDSGSARTVRLVYHSTTNGTFPVTVFLSQDDNTTNDTLKSSLTFYKPNTLVENFYATTFPPKEWKIYLKSPNAYATAISRANTGVSGQGAVQFPNDNYATAINPCVKTLVTPQIRPEAGSRLTFYAKRDTYNSSTAITFKVLVSEGSAEVDSFQTVLKTYPMGMTTTDSITPDWKKYELDMSAYVGKNIFVAFQTIATASSNVIYLDDVEGEIPLCSFANDARVQSVVLTQPDKIWFAKDTVEVKATLDNHGSDTLKNHKVYLSVNGNKADSLSVTLVPGKDTAVTLKWGIPLAGNYILKVTLPDDDNNINNTKQLSAIKVYPEGYFIESFEEHTGNDFLPPYWTNPDKNQYGNNAWSWAYNGHTGGHGVVCSFPGNYRIITPLLKVTANDSLCFYAYSNQASRPPFAVLSSKDGVNWDTLMRDTTVQNTWKAEKILFKDSSASWLGNRYFAFMTLGVAYVTIDDVEGCFLADRADQFKVASVFAAPGHINKAGSVSKFSAVLYNDGTKDSSRVVSLCRGNEVLTTAASRKMAPGKYDTVVLEYTFTEPLANAPLTVNIPEDAYVFDNEFTFNALVYPYLYRLQEGFNDMSSTYWQLGANWSSVASQTKWDPTVSANRVITPNEGDNMLKFYFSSNAQPLAVSPYISAKTPKYEVSVDVYRYSFGTNSDRPDKMEFAFGAGPVWEDVLYIDSINRLESLYPVEENDGWHTYKKRVDFGSMEGGFLMMRPVPSLNAYGYADYEFMLFDNMVIRPIYDTDIEVVAIVAPEDIVTASNKVVTPLSVRVRNIGDSAITAVTFEYGVGSTKVDSIRWTGYIASGKDTVLALSAAVELNITQDTLFYVEAKVANDGNLLNNRAEKTLTVKAALRLPFYEGFEAANSLADWTTYTFSTDNGKKSWFRDTTGEYVTAIFGKAGVYSASLDDSLGAVHPDNWLVSPGLVIDSAYANLSFYVQATDATHFAETYQVLVSTTSATDTTAFTAIHTATLESDDSLHVVLPLNNYKDRMVYVAFRHFNCTDQYRIALDSVYVYNCAAPVQPVEPVEPDTFTITLTAGAGGSLSPNGTVKVAEGGELTVIVSADEGYEVDSVTVDGAKVSLVGDTAYTFTNVTANHALTASFKSTQVPPVVPDTFTITLTAGAGGSLSPNGTVKVVEGGELTVIVSADEGYEVDSVTVDGAKVSLVGDTAYTFTNVTANHALVASFRKTVSTANTLADAFRLTVAPNPFVNQIKVVSSMPIRSLNIVALNGRRVFTGSFVGEKEVVLTPNLSEGLYLLYVEDMQGRISVQKIVKR